jgi:tuberculosinol/isotuberculosinol synthase
LEEEANMKPLSREEFLRLPKEELANLVRADGQKVCVFPFNGTRRWFLLEHGREFSGKNAAQKYVEQTTHAYISTYKLVYDNGVDTIVAPVFGSEIFSRGEEYMREIGAGMELLATHPEFLAFYKAYDIRVHFYGDYRKQLEKTPYADICDSFDKITRDTAHHTTRRLFYGVCGEDATEAVADLSIRHHQQTGLTPTREQLVEMYYGEYIEKADIFIGFEKFNVFDYPLLSKGGESLYFTVAPSLYMNERQWRSILHDHLYLRPIPEPDYFTMPTADFESMRKFYEDNREVTFGVGEVRGGIWYSENLT